MDIAISSSATSNRSRTKYLNGNLDQMCSLRGKKCPHRCIELRLPGRSIPGLETIWNARSTTFVVAAMLMIATFLPTMMGVRNPWLFYGALYGSLTMLAISGVMSHLSSRRISAYLRQNGSRHSADTAIIKDFVQKLISSLSRHFSETKIDASKYPLELNNTDYLGIRIIKRPGFRRTYQVLVETPLGRA